MESRLDRCAALVGLAAMVAAGLSAGCRAAPARHAPIAPTVDSALAVATFDSAWSRIRASRVDSAAFVRSWDSVRTALRPRVERRPIRDTLHAVIREMIARVGESHYAFVTSDVAAGWKDAGDRADSSGGAFGDVGMDLRLLGGDFVVSRVAAGGPAARAEVRAGWIIDRIGDTSLDTLRRAWRAARSERERRLALTELPHVAMRRLRGPSGTTVRLEMRDGNGRRVNAELVRVPAAGEVVRFGLLPPTVAHLEFERYLQDWGCVGVVRFNVWMTAVLPAFERALESVSGCDGVILDLRGNPGGLAAMIMGVAGAFLERPEVLGVLRARGGELRYVANPRRVSAAGAPVRPVDKPLAILVDPLSASTTEIFGASLQQLGRARVFGEPSAGQALPATLYRLPNDDVLLHAIGDFVLPDGRRVEGRGIQPDVLLPLSRADLLAGRDAPLLAAISWIRHARDRHSDGS